MRTTEMAHDRRRGFRTDHRTIDGPRADTDGLQVLQELCVNLQRKVARPGRLSPEEIRDIVADDLTWHVVVNDGRVAWSIRSRIPRTIYLESSRPSVGHDVE